MTRVMRERSRSGIYHVMIRGINKQNIFENDNDYKKFISLLRSYKPKLDYSIYAYVLMDNHVHLLLKEGDEDISNTMRRIEVSYACWFNWQYERTGHLFQDRFRSKAVESEAQLLNSLRYIHQNPIKAGLASTVNTYPWSSYSEYLDGEYLVDTNYVLGLFDKRKEKALENFVDFNSMTEVNASLEIDSRRKTIADEVIKRQFFQKFEAELATVQNREAHSQKEMLQYLKSIDGVSFRQLSRLTGLTVSKIFRV